MTPANFDFNKAVDLARRDYPKETKDMVFVDFADPNAAEKVEAWRKTLPLRTRFKLKRKGAYDANNVYIPRSAPTKALVTFDSRKLPDSMWHHPDSYTKSLAFEFQRQFAHALFPHPAIVHSFSRKDSSDHDPYKLNKPETVADTFAALRALQTGELTAKDIEKISGERVRVGSFGLNHRELVTTLALDKLFADHRVVDLLKLPPAETKALAAQHAEKYAPTPAAMKKAFDVQACLEGEILVQAQDRVVRDADQNSLEFYLVARSLVDVYSSDGAKMLKCVEMTQAELNDWADEIDALRTKAAAVGIEGIPPSLTRKMRGAGQQKPSAAASVSSKPSKASKSHKSPKPPSR